LDGDFGSNENFGKVIIGGVVTIGEIVIGGIVIGGIVTIGEVVGAGVQLLLAHQYRFPHVLQVE
jgi:hypothetical protein